MADRDAREAELESYVAHWQRAIDDAKSRHREALRDLRKYRREKASLEELSIYEARMSSK